MSGNGPLVTGISPKEGAPGTKVTIRGERLGKSHRDLIRLEICGIDCTFTAEWYSPNKIQARTLLCKGRGDIIVTTQSEGTGSSSVQFRGFQETIGPANESAVWVDETINVGGTRPLSMATYQQEDPLQISAEGNDKKYPMEELMELFPEGSGNLRADNFVPAWFLLENHHATGFEDLKSGLHFLSRRVGSQSEGKLSFLKENMSSVVDQLDALIILKSKLDIYCQKHGNGFISRIDESIGVSEKEATKLFQDVLSRKDRADVTRNAISGFQRFKFLFSLPGTMEKCIQKGEFENAINDYSRAKALFEQPETDKPVFRKFRDEIEGRVQKLRTILRTKLIEKSPNPEEQLTIIGYLVTLECDFDPAWACLVSRYEFITNTIKNCFQQYSTAEKVKDNMLRTPKQDNQGSSPTQVQFIEALCDLFITYFPDFWHLGMDYFSGKLPSKPNMGKQANMKKMTVSIIQLFSSVAASCLLPNTTCGEFVWLDEKSETMNEWLPHCITEIREAFNELLSLDPPGDVLDTFRSLLFSIRSHALIIMVHQMAVDISDLYKQESWISEPQEYHGFVTQLPSKYETLVVGSAKVIKETLLQKYTEERHLLKNEEVKVNFQESMGTALASFADSMEMLISKNPDFNPQTPSSKANINKGQRSSGNSIPSTQSASLLLILNNSSYTIEIILPQIHRAFIKLGFPDLTDAIEKAKEGINAVVNLTFAKYTEMKYEPVVGQIEQSMYIGHFDWERCIEPANVRPYITKALLGMIEVISEVTSVSEKLISTVMTHVVENVCEELTRLFSCVSKFNENGALQGTVDVAAFQATVLDFLTPSSKTLLKETFGLIPQSKELLRSRKCQELLDVYRSRTSMQFNCFVLKRSNNVQ